MARPEKAREFVDDGKMSLRSYLVLRALDVPGVDVFTAMEAVSTTALSHPEWDMAERRTFPEWEEQFPWLVEE